MKNEIIRNFYDKEKVVGILLFGSTVTGRNSPTSDIDIVIFENGTGQFKHTVEIKNNIHFDVFRMPIEYGFYLLYRRDQMWIYSFYMADVVVSCDGIAALISTAKYIVEQEKPVIDSVELARRYYAINNKSIKLAELKRRPVEFSFVLHDLLNKVGVFLHYATGRWPGFGSSVDKIKRLIEDFGVFSELIRKILYEQSVEDKLLLVKELMNLLAKEFVQQKHSFLLIQSVDVSSVLENFYKKTML